MIAANLHSLQTTKAQDVDEQSLPTIEDQRNLAATAKRAYALHMVGLLHKYGLLQGAVEDHVAATTAAQAAALAAAASDSMAAAAAVAVVISTQSLPLPATVKEVVVAPLPGDVNGGDGGGSKGGGVNPVAQAAHAGIGGTLQAGTMSCLITTMHNCFTCLGTIYAKCHRPLHTHVHVIVHCIQPLHQCEACTNTGYMHCHDHRPRLASPSNRMQHVGEQ